MYSGRPAHLTRAGFPVHSLPMRKLVILLFALAAILASIFVLTSKEPQPSPLLSQTANRIDGNDAADAQALSFQEVHAATFGRVAAQQGEICGCVVCNDLRVEASLRFVA